jgi:transposase
MHIDAYIHYLQCVRNWFGNYVAGNAKEMRPSKSRSDTRGHPVLVESLLETYCKSCGVNVIFLPKFHCELNFIEQCWGYAK